MPIHLEERAPHPGHATTSLLLASVSKLALSGRNNPDLNIVARSAVAIRPPGQELGPCISITLESGSFRLLQGQVILILVSSGESNACVDLSVE